MKKLFITEKPSVAMEFAHAIGSGGKRMDGYFEDDNYVITWCLGHLVTMSYPDKYDPDMQEWSMDTLPFIPAHYRYEVIPESKKQYDTVAKLLNKPDIGAIYYAGDSGREGEYIQRLVRQMAGRNMGAKEFRVWIDSQTNEEIRRGIREAAPLSKYDALSESAYARAIEDYCIGINYSRVLTVALGRDVGAAAGQQRATLSVGRVMSCVLGMVVKREREIRENIKIPYFPVTATIGDGIEFRFRPGKGSSYYGEEDLYNRKGFLERKKAEQFVGEMETSPLLEKADPSVVKKHAPLLFNLAELQAFCTKNYHISPDKTLQIAQSLYKKKLTTYPRTDARVLTTAMCKVIHVNILGLSSIEELSSSVAFIREQGAWKDLEKTRYVDDSAVTDHYAIIPTGKTQAYAGLDGLERQVYLAICRRFLSIFYPPAEFYHVEALLTSKGESFHTSAEYLLSPGWLIAAGTKPESNVDGNTGGKEKALLLRQLSVGQRYLARYDVRQEVTKPPRRYTTGSMVLAMENAGKLIEDEELREQIKRSGIGTSATRADTIKKLISIKYLQCSKEQVLSPTLLGEAVFEALDICVPSLLSPEMTASWEKGLQGISDGHISREQYLEKLYKSVIHTVSAAKTYGSSPEVKTSLRERMERVYPFHGKGKAPAAETYVCPLCRKEVRKGKGGFYCTGRPEGCEFFLWESWCQKRLSDANVKALLSGKKTALIKGFKSKAGTAFSARLQIKDGRIVPEFEKGGKK